LENQRRVCATFQYKINALIFVTKHVWGAPKFPSSSGWTHFY
jgi:hypothetical protein